MIRKNRRLKKESIKNILRQGRNLRGQNVALKYIIDSGQFTSFAFIVPAKIAKKAVLRNKMKRMGRAIVFRLLPRIKEGYLALIFFEKGSPVMKFAELEAEIIKLLQKADFFK